MLYGICIAFPTQHRLHEEWCFNSEHCGKGIFAFIDGGPGIGALGCCRQDECPIQESLLDDMDLTVNNPSGEAEPIRLRKLHDPAAVIG